MSRGANRERVSNRSVVVPPLGDAPFEMTITANMALALLKLAANKDRHSDSIDYDLTGGPVSICPFCAMCHSTRAALLQRGYRGNRLKYI